MFDEGGAQLQSMRARPGSPDGEGEEREVVRALVMAGAQVDAQGARWQKRLQLGASKGTGRQDVPDPIHQTSKRIGRT